MTDRTSLENRQVDLWYVLLDEAADPLLLDKYRALLPADELAQEQRFLVETSRLQYLVGRVLARAALSHYTGSDPRRWTFSYNAFGKPSVQSAAEPRLEFNLSHTAGLVVCAVAAGREVGVDVEHVHRRADTLGLARRFFAPAEAAVLERLPAEERPLRFLQFWTLKEALIKARGMGLAMPLDQFAFALAPGRPPTVSFAPEVPERPGQWQFAQIRVGGCHQVAVAVRQPAEERLVIRAWETLPLVSRSEGRVLPGHQANEWTH